MPTRAVQPASRTKIFFRTRTRQRRTTEDGGGGGRTEGVEPPRQEETLRSVAEVVAKPRPRPKPKEARRSSGEIWDEGLGLALMPALSPGSVLQYSAFGAGMRGCADRSRWSMRVASS